jgi:hypothetical protein
MRENKLLGPDVDLNDLAARSKNFSGAGVLYVFILVLRLFIYSYYIGLLLLFLTV